MVESIGLSSSPIHYIQHGAEHIKEKVGHETTSRQYQYMVMTGWPCLVVTLVPEI